MSLQRDDHTSRDAQAVALCVLVAVLVLVAAVVGIDDLIVRLPI